MTDYRLMLAPWRRFRTIPTAQNPTGQMGPREHAAMDRLDQVCELLTTTFIAERMGDDAEYAKASSAALAYLGRLTLVELYQMILSAAAPHAGMRSTYVVEVIPDSIPPDWTRETDA